MKCNVPVRGRGDKRPTPRGVGGLKLHTVKQLLDRLCPTPRGVGGLKSSRHSGRVERLESHPSRGGWIEMALGGGALKVWYGPTPRGVGGLKF